MPDYAIGVDMGGTNLRIAAITTEGKLLEKITLGVKLALGRDYVIGEMCDAIHRLTEQYRESGGKKWPRQKSQQKLREALRAKLPRGRSGDMRQIAAELNPLLRGWYGYFKYSLPSGLQGADEWVRERLRHILRRRHKRRGMVKGREHIEYPIKWFAAHGLFNLKNAQAQWLQSLSGNH